MLEQLKHYLTERFPAGICIAFSGGVDSALLLKVASEVRKPSERLLAVTFDTALHPQGDQEEAARLAAELGVEHRVVAIDEFSNPEIRKNPPERCYLCKKLLFSTLLTLAEQEGFGVVMDGTNADDLTVYRPGIRALRELGVLSPLAELQMDKKTVRALAEELHLSVSKKPSTPCLATRLPYGDTLDRELLSRIAKGEEYLKSLGFSVVRLRVHGEVARIEIEKREFSTFLNLTVPVVMKLKELGFSYVTLDLEGFRSGSMDLHILEEKDGRI